MLAESGAITEYLIARHAPDRLAPAADSPEYPEYLQWLHFAESSGILPLLLDMFVRKDGSPMRFLPDYAKAECAKVLGYLDEVLANRRYLVANRLTGADILNSFLVDLLAQSGQLAQFPHLRPTGSDSTLTRPARRRRPWSASWTAAPNKRRCPGDTLQNAPMIGAFSSVGQPVIRGRGERIRATMVARMTYSAGGRIRLPCRDRCPAAPRGRSARNA